MRTAIAKLAPDAPEIDRKALSDLIANYQAAVNLEMSRVDAATVPLAQCRANAKTLVVNGYALTEVTKILYTRRQSQQYHADGNVRSWAQSCALVAAPGDTTPWTYEDAQWRYILGMSYNKDFSGGWGASAQNLKSFDRSHAGLSCINPCVPKIILPFA